MIVNLYTTSACHLCEQALDLLQNLPLELTIVEVEIANSDELMQRYGLTIPVVAVSNSKQELNWPFDSNQLLDFLSRFS